MFKFIKKYFFTAMTSFGCSVLSVISSECVSVNNQECKLRSEIVDVNSNEPLFYPYSLFYPLYPSLCQELKKQDI